MNASVQKITKIIESHPVISTAVLGSIGLGITLVITKNKSNSTNAPTTSGTINNGVCYDSSGNPIDCSTGAPIGYNNGGFGLSPANGNADIYSMFSQFQQMLQNVLNAININNSGNSGNSSGGSTNPPRPTTPPPINLPPAPQSPPGRNGKPPINFVPPPIRVQTKTEDYTVQKGQSLTSIAKAFGISETWLASWNKQLSNPNWSQKPWWDITPGTHLNIPYQGNRPIPVFQKATTLIHSPTTFSTAIK